MTRQDAEVIAAQLEATGDYRVLIRIGGFMDKQLMFGAIALLSLVFGCIEGVFAQRAREGQEMFQNGQTYRCERTGSELTQISQSRSCEARTPSITGTWRGTGHQSPAGSTGPDWSIVMTISANGGSIEYPSLGCGGELTKISGDDTSAQYREKITFGNKVCIDDGTITAKLSQGKLSWTWVGQSGGQNYNAIALLTLTCSPETLSLLGSFEENGPEA